MNPIKSLLRVAIRRSRRERGSSDLTVALLMTAAGAAMVGATVPSLFRSSDTAARTFDRQVKILERGTGGASAPGGAGGGMPSFDVGGAPMTMPVTGQSLTGTANIAPAGGGAIASPAGPISNSNTPLQNGK